MRKVLTAEVTFRKAQGEDIETELILEGEGFREAFRMEDIAVDEDRRQFALALINNVFASMEDIGPAVCVEFDPAAERPSAKA